MSKRKKKPEPTTDIKVMGVDEWKIDDVCIAAKQIGAAVLYIPDEYRYEFVDISILSS
jgi:hypothetical protein